MPPGKPLTAKQIEAQLDDYLEVEFSFLKTAEPAAVLAALKRQEQDYIINWVKRVASINIQLAYQFINQAVSALDQLDKRTIEAWVLYAMDIYDLRGLHPALAIIQNVEHFLKESHERAVGSVLEDEIGILLHFSHGLSGRKLKIESAEAVYTDSETIFLPPVTTSLANSNDNFLCYKAMVACLWAQSRFGTFRIPLNEILGQQQHPEKFLSLFHAFESVRLEACIEQELPGLFRDMLHIKQQLAIVDDRSWLELTKALRSPGATVKDVLSMTHQHFKQLVAPSPALYHGILHPDLMEICMRARLEKEKAALRSALIHMADDIQSDATEPHRQSPKFKAQRIEDPTEPDGYRMSITLDDQPLPLPPDIDNLLTSIQQDLGDIPDDYLVPAGPGDYDPDYFKKEEADPDDVWQGTYHEDGAFLYKEWDYQRQHYRKNWCAVREKTVNPVYDDFVSKTLGRYSGLIKHLRKTFEAIRDEDKLLKRQVNGDGIDIDTLIEALADARDGSEMNDRLFTHMHRTERNIAVIFMVDMSGSTKGWINDAERESLILLAETMESLGDRYAIYGFSGLARKRCEIYKIKSFDDSYDNEVKARISGIQPQDYTRMGFANRHLSHKLSEVDANTRILITISDGKPDDYDNYRGQYGIEDTRRALVETRRDGIHPYCITIDTEAKDYLPYMYGDAGYTVVDEVHKLPLKVSDIYRQLTT
ncbi:MAG TPA: nitric oxide reductase activation protein [Acidiferrobacteraceae bacterium]|nr:nitric oxide reductase activation protein [Acidiferrobacteraceae bacterium]HEX19763.1 nitric oxide reductase activation protein [Acidiferrobacteraceae bacterium]